MLACRIFQTYCLFLSQPTSPIPILPSSSAPGAGIILTIWLCLSIVWSASAHRFKTQIFLVSSLAAQLEAFALL